MKPVFHLLAGLGIALFCEANASARELDWTTHRITFNSLDHDEVGVYFGTWGAAKGTIWWEEPKIAEEGLVNVLRRDGCPLVVKTEDDRMVIMNWNPKNLRQTPPSLPGAGTGKSLPAFTTATLRRSSPGLKWPADRPE